MSLTIAIFTPVLRIYFRKSAKDRCLKIDTDDTQCNGRNGRSKHVSLSKICDMSRMVVKKFVDDVLGVDLTRCFSTFGIIVSLEITKRIDLHFCNIINSSALQ